MDTNHAPPPSGHPGHVSRTGDAWKKYVLIAVLAMIVMAAGAVVGAGAAILYFGRMFVREPGTPDQAARLITRRLSDSANLSPEERVRTEALVERQMAEVAEIRKKYEEEIAGKLGIISDGVSEIIGPERAGMCGEWMHRYRGRGNAPGKEGHGCGESGAGCGMEQCPAKISSRSF